jgi:hypothetical protein
MRLSSCFAALASVCVLGPASVTTAQAGVVDSCVATSTFDIGNSLTAAGGVPGTWTRAGDCGVVDTGGLPFGAVTFGPGSFVSVPYTYSGTCYEGSMSFTGGIAVFVAGFFVAETQANGRIAEWVGALVPSSAGTVCKGAPGSALTWSGPSQGNGI